MIEKNELNEGSITLALTQGYITSKEAEQMRKVYLYKLTSSSLPYNKTKQINQGNTYFPAR